MVAISMERRGPTALLDPKEGSQAVLTYREWERQDEAATELQRLTQLFDDSRQHRSHQNKLSLDQARCDGEGSNARSLLISLLPAPVSPDNQPSISGLASPWHHGVFVARDEGGYSVFLCARAFATMFSDTALWASCVIYPCRRMHQGVN